MDAVAGYVYVMINPSVKGIVKIGKTRNDPENRAKELSSATGVPTPFFVAYQAYFKDCSKAEVFVHTFLANNRLTQNKEFFRISVRQAIKAVIEAENSLGVIQEPDSTTDIGIIETSTKPLLPWKTVFHSANAHSYGIGDAIQEHSEAFQLYTEAIKLGSVSAYWILGNMYLKGDGCKQNLQKAKEAYQVGIKAGNDLCWTGLAEVYFQEGHQENWDKCWIRYFGSALFLEKKQYSEFIKLDEIRSNRAYQMYNYGQQAKLNGWNISQKKLLIERTLEIEEFSKLNRSQIVKLILKKPLVWDSLWPMFEIAEAEEKGEIWKQLDLEHFLHGLDAKHQIEILRKAPQDIINLVKKHIHLETLLALKPTQSKKPVANQKMSKRILRMTMG